MRRAGPSASARHRAPEPVVEVLRLPAAEGGGAVLDQRLGVDQPLVEAQRIDEGLQRRSRRAQRPRHVHEAARRAVGKLRRADLRQDVPAAVIGQQDRGRHLLGLARDRPGGQPLGGGLQTGVDGRLNPRRARVFAAQPVGQQRGMGGEGAAAIGQERGAGGSGGLGVDDPQGQRPVDHAVPRGPCRGPRLWQIGAASLGRLRQGHQQGGFGGGQAARLLAEPHQACRAHPLGVAAIGREPKIQVEDAVLSQAPFQRQRDPRLPQLGAPVPRRPTLQQPRRLHRQGRGAGHDAAVRDRLPRGAQDGAAVHAVMGAEAPVLPPDEHRQEARVHPFLRGRKPPQPVAHRKGPQQRAVAGENLGPDRHGQRRQLGRVDPAVPGGARPVPAVGCQSQRDGQRDQAAAEAALGLRA